VGHPSLVSPLLPAAGAIALLMLLTWLLSVAKRDASIVDSCWGLGFVLVAWLAWALGGAAQSPAALLLPGLVTLWGGRLSLYLTWRNWGEPEDYRYQAMRRRHEPFWLKSLWIVFGLQGALMWLISLPLLCAGAPPLGVLDALGAALALAGIACETLADLQLARFKADPSNEGQVLDSGLWAWTRHPNYFGDFVTWWGLWGVALGRGAPAWTVVAPLLMSGLLLKVSGVPLLEGRLKRTRPKYADYVARTPAFFPRPPRSTS